MANPTLKALILGASDAVAATAATAGQLAGVQGDAAKLFPVSVAGTTLLNLTPAANIADPTGGATTDTEARAAIVLILNALEAAKIVAVA